MVLRTVFAMAVFAAILCACHESDTPLVAPQAGEPCGNAGVVCYDSINGSTQPTGGCCYEGSVCGGGWPNVGCPVDSCCYEGLDGMKLEWDGTHQFARIVPQFRARY